VKQFVLRFGIVVVLAGVSLGQTAQTALPTDPGMYFEAAGGLTKIIGQIAEFKRSGSALVSHATVGIKSQKENIQMLGRRPDDASSEAHAAAPKTPSNEAPAPSESSDDLPF